MAGCCLYLPILLTTLKIALLWTKVAPLHACVSLPSVQSSLTMCVQSSTYTHILGGKGLLGSYFPNGSQNPGIMVRETCKVLPKSRGDNLEFIWENKTH